MRPTLLSDDLLFTWSQSQIETGCVGKISGDSLTNYQGSFRRGHGRNEFMDVILGKGKDSCIYIASVSAKHNQILSMTHTGKAKSIEAVKDTEAWTIYDLSKLPNWTFGFMNYVVLSDSTCLFLGTPFGDLGHIMSIIDFKNQTLKPLDFWPEDGSKVEGLAKVGVYIDTGNILGNNEDRFLYVCGEGNYAFIFTIDGSSVHVKKELYSQFPEYDYMGEDKVGRMNYSIKNRPALHFETDANGNHIYLLKIEDDKDGKAAESWKTSVCGNEIEVYDWEGNLEKKIVLDQLGHNIKVTEDDRLLYLFSEDWETGEPQIWAYDLRN